MLQVCLPVQILCLDEADSFGCRAIQEVHVTREKLVLADSDDAANLDVFSLAVVHLIFAMRNYFADVLVFRFVLLTPLPVLEGILDHGDTDHEHQWHYSCSRTTLCAYARYELQQEHHEEVGIGHLGELFEEVQRQKVEASVLGCANGVGVELALRVIPIEDCVDLEYTSLLLPI